MLRTEAAELTRELVREVLRNLVLRGEERVRHERVDRFVGFDFALRRFFGAAVRPDAREIDRSVRAISDATFDRAVSILATNRAVLENGARQLLQKETLTEDEIGTIAASLKRPA